MEKLKGIVVVVGNYGSGKTEVSINLAVNRKRAGIDVRIADLDLVNPYFRTREARKPLAKLGIEVVMPAEKYLKADLPILSPVVAGLIRRPSQLTLIDAGGNDVGATVLASLADAFRKTSVQMLQVVNPYRPFTETIEGCLKMRDEIEKTSKMTISGIIGWMASTRLILPVLSPYLIVPIETPGRQIMPVSSRTSRRAASRSDSPLSSLPLGSVQSR